MKKYFSPWEVFFEGNARCCERIVAARALLRSNELLFVFRGYYTRALVLTLFQENYDAELTLCLKTLLPVYTAAEFVEPLCRKQVKSAQRNFPVNATDFADIPL